MYAHKSFPLKKEKIQKLTYLLFIVYFSDNDDIYCMKENEICRFYGKVLLKPVGRFHLKEFMRIWQDSVPEGIHCSQFLINQTF